MEELAKIITVISSRLDIDRTSILTGSDYKSSKAREILCHVIKDGFPHLMKVLCEFVNISSSAVYKAAARAEMRNNSDPSFRRFVNSIRHELSLPFIKKCVCEEEEKSKPPVLASKKNRQNIPVSQQIFGFKWEDRDNVRIWGAETDSVDFMRKYCSIGIQPIAEGMVMTRQISSR